MSEEVNSRICEAQANTVRAIRAYFGLTVKEFAARVKCNPISIFYYEHGERVIKPSVLYMISKEFGIPAEMVMGLKELSFPAK